MQNEELEGQIERALRTITSIKISQRSQHHIIKEALEKMIKCISMLKDSVSDTKTEEKKIYQELLIKDAEKVMKGGKNEINKTKI